ncbi:MAG TPA: glutathione S-transferase family protein [Solirubrobacteraceae bacterium]|nr:glutathione S-transferase family protein [Solirubrobacteraceae bacterium]
MNRPRLWSWELSPFAAKARIALSVKEIEVELIEIDPRHRPARLRALNPAGRVPVLEIAECAVVQSTAICEWAQEVGSGPSLWPADPLERARARGLLRWVDDELTTNFFLSMRKQAFGLDPDVDHPDLVQQLRTTLVKRWSPLERMLADSPTGWLLGSEGPLLPDLAALPLAVRLLAWAPDLQPSPDVHPCAVEWLTALRDHPAAAEVVRRGEPAPAP